MWRNVLIALAALALVTLGLGVIVYTLARDRIMPTPTPPRATVVRSAVPSNTPLPSETPVPSATVVGTVREYSPGALIIVLSPVEGDVEQVIVSESARVAFADGRRASPEEVVPGQTLYAEGPLDALGRMIATQITIVRERPTAPVPTQIAPSPPSPSATPSPSPTSALPQGVWQGEYYGNKSFQGAPTLVREDAEVKFQWHTGAPAPGLPRDYFSVRWRGRWNLAEGGYRFYACSDDGVRVWVDGALIIDQWSEQAATTVQGHVYLEAGDHELRVEYYDATGNAQVWVWWDCGGPYPNWKAEYYADPDLAGRPALVRDEVDVDFDWGRGSPAPELSLDQFSARWTRSLTLGEGAYRFRARADDGIKLWVDTLLIIDEWHECKPQTYSGFIWLDSAPHNLRVEYYEDAGNASAHVWWEKLDRFHHWKGEYYANPDLAGRPAYLRDDEAISFDWVNESPGSGLPKDNFSVRWTRVVTLEKRIYRFWAIADDGVRLYVDDDLLIDDWSDSPARLYEAETTLARGRHTVIVEYYERGDKALVQVGWDAAATPTPTQTLTPSPTPTGTPTVPTRTPSTTPTRTARPPTPTPTRTQASGTATATPSPTPSPTPSQTVTPGPLPTPLPTSTSLPTPSATGTSVVAFARQRGMTSSPSLS